MIDTRTYMDLEKIIFELNYPDIIKQAVQEKIYNDKKAIEDKGYGLIMMAKTNQMYIKDLIDQYRHVLADSAKYYIKGYDIYGLTIKKTLNSEDKGHYFHIFYNGQKANDERIALLERYARLEE